MTRERCSQRQPGEANMSNITASTAAPTEVSVAHQTAETRFIAAGGVRLAFRRFSSRSS